jgi:NADH-quinone oxidoreductase subunit G
MALNIEIDGQQIEVEPGTTVMDAAHKLGIYIPHFCYHKKLSIAANCRMCLVQVEKAPKPLPACATPVSDGMKVMTRSDYAIQAQKGVMEFLLINHPLDCPICDQGGECQLQDLAVGYGGSASNYAEPKRVVTEKNLGPLVSTDMTRCIHCTRCVRFGQEIAGIMEMGQAFRGEHAEIMPFIDKTIDSELSGNIIDLCPVGALTSKPFRYAARSWELSRRKGVSPHDSLGSNLQIQVKNGKVMRVLPLDNEDINECWLSDRDRFSYEGLNSEDRLTRPMIRKDGAWVDADWQEALSYVASRLREIQVRHGAEQIGALAAPNQTTEEFYLLQKLMRGLGSGNIDHRLRQSDFRLDDKAHGAFSLGMPVAALNMLDRFLVVGSTLRKDHPLLALRLRQAVRHGAGMNLINPVVDDYLCKVANKSIVSPDGMVAALAGLVRSLAEAKGEAVPAVAGNAEATPEIKAIAESMISGENKGIFLGNLAQHHPRYAEMHTLAQEAARLCGAKLGVLGDTGNALGAVTAGAIPGRGAMGAQGVAGMNSAQMIASPRKAYVLLGAEPEYDCHDPVAALAAMRQAEFVVAMSPFKHAALDYADVLLPISPFTETSGTFINTEGRVQSFNGAVKPLGETRPAWKVLRVLGNLLNLAGFEQDSSEAVRDEVLGQDTQARVQQFLNNRIDPVSVSVASTSKIERIGEVPIYQTDAIVRRAVSLQRTADAAPPVAKASGMLLEKLGIQGGGMAVIRQGQDSIVIRIDRDDCLPANCVRLPGAHAVTAPLGPLFGELTVERA